MGLIWYVKDMTRRGLPIDANTIVLNDLHRGHMAYEAYVQNRDKGENIKALEKWCDKYDFDDWDRKVTETLSLVYGRNYCSIAYVIQPEKPAGWDPVVDAVNDYERLMYQLPLHGIAFEQDNETVFSFIQLAVVHTQAETWIFDHVPGRNGRGAMQALRNHYEGDAELDVQASKAQHVLDTLVYTNERHMTFEAMITKLNKAYNALKRQGQEFTEKSKVEQLAKRIKNPSRDIQITVAVENMREIHKANYTAATQYITTSMAKFIVLMSMPQGRMPAASLRLAQATWRAPNGTGSIFATHGGNSPRTNGTPNWETVARSLSGLNAETALAGAMVDMDEAAVAAAAGVEVTKVVAVAGITTEAAEARIVVMTGASMRPRRVTVPRRQRKAREEMSLQR